MSLEEKSNFFSWISVSFLKPVLKIGKEKTVEYNDLGNPCSYLNPESLNKKFGEEWNKEKQKAPEKQSLVNACIRSTEPKYWFWSVVFYVLGLVINFFPSLVLKVLLLDLEGTSVLSTQMRWYYIFLLFLIPLCGAICVSISRMLIARVGVSMKMILQDAIYRKVFHLSSVATQSVSTGELVNIMSTDTSEVISFTCNILVLFAIPISLLVCTFLVIRELGVLVAVAILLLAVSPAIQYLSVSKLQQLRNKELQATDSRIKIINEVLMSIRSIKFLSLEKPLMQKIESNRKTELEFNKAIAILVMVGINLVSQITPYLVPVVCFVLYPTVMGKPLVSSVAFTCLSLLKLLNFPFAMLPSSLTTLTQFNVSVKRITKFLNMEEQQSEIVSRNLPAGSKPVYQDLEGKEKTIEDYDAEKDAVIIREGHFAWGDSEPCLKNITTRIPKGSLVAVVGRVGSGKTSFVSALIGEMTKKAGAVLVNGSMSLSAQQAWLVNDTVRNNILFGKEYDEKKYKEVIKVCSLEDDLKVLNGGDQCEIGDRGINVSGGQKARISLARACYSDSDIVVMDDPIAAVDSHVGKAIFNKCIFSYMQGRTRILVTNATQYLNKCDYIIVLDNQTISHQGTFDDLKEQNVDFVTFVNEENEEEEKEETQSETSEQTQQKTTKGSEGKIAWSVYAYYFKLFGIALIIVILLLYCISSFMYIRSLFLLSDWADDKSCHDGDVTTCNSATTRYIIYYLVYNLLYIGCVVLRSVLILPGRLRAAKTTHTSLITTILRAGMDFHDVTPIGAVLNRFSKDINVVDSLIASSIASFLDYLFQLLSETINISFSTNFLVFVVLICSFITYLSIHAVFKKPNTDLQRLQAETQSPVFSDYQAILLGRSSIRAFSQEERFTKKMETNIQRNLHVVHIQQHMATYLTWRSDLLAAALNCLTAVAVYFVQQNVSAGHFGIALTSSSGINGILKYIIQQMISTEMNMNAVERIKEYVDTVKPEPPMITDVRPPQNWPSEGKIEFKDAKLRYRDGPLVMKGVSLSIDSKEKIGVVGRTGAGKSTMMIALFRITDLCEGSITIDGMDLHELGLEDVRRALCIIPQDPVLFSATVRFNLDPFDESTDEDIWNVLEQVQLKEAIQNLPKGLDDDVHEGGSNFSVGERQLICMARALLRKPTILVMDEATASLDNTTDTFLQQMIRKQFAHCTTLTIAHRLNTIMDSTRVCVMDQGIVAEYDTPYNLLHKEDGIFKGMVLAANDPTLFDMVPGCEEMKNELKK